MPTHERTRDMTGQSTCKTSGERAPPRDGEDREQSYKDDQESRSRATPLGKQTTAPKHEGYVGDQGCVGHLPNDYESHQIAELQYREHMTAAPQTLSGGSLSSRAGANQAEAACIEEDSTSSSDESSDDNEGEDEVLSKMASLPPRWNEDPARRTILTRWVTEGAWEAVELALPRTAPHPRRGTRRRAPQTARIPASADHSRASRSPPRWPCAARPRQ